MASPTVIVPVSGARGESYADILRRTGTFGVLPGDTDAQALAKVNADALASAAIALAASGPNYADTAAGLAATAEGDTFAVSADGIVTVYLHDTGSVATELRTLPTTAAFASTASDKGAALLGTKQTFTGAVARTQADKNADVVSVRDAGAVGGTAGPFPDDTASIQAAIDAQGTYSIGLGKSVYLPDGLYKLTASLTTENIQRFYGAGPRQSILYNEQNPIPTIAAFYASGSLVFSSFENFGMRSQKSGFDIASDTDQNNFRDLHIYDMADAAFRFRGILQTTVFDRLEIDTCATGIVSETTTCNLVVGRDVSFKDMVGVSISLAGSQSATFSGARFEGSGDAAKNVIELTGSQQLIFDGGYAEACHKTFLNWTGTPSGVVEFQDFHWTYFSAGVPFLWNVDAGAQLVFQNCESDVAMEVPAGSILIGHNKNIYCANPSVASASTTTLPERIPVVSITGTTTIDAITGGNQYIGYLVTLLFADAATLRDVSTGGNCHLAGATNFVASSNDAITLTFDGATWIEVSRSVN